MTGGRQPGAFAGIDLLVVEDADGWSRWLGCDPQALARTAVTVTAARAGLPETLETELGVTLANDAAVKALNAKWRGKDEPTNILSFPTRRIVVGEVPGPLMGDLVLARETCAREAAAEGKTPADHVTHLLVHGVLHLLGHDHLEDGEAERMERLEVQILADLQIADPYGQDVEGPAAAENGAATTERRPGVGEV